jgi:hypothetical protein
MLLKAYPKNVISSNFPYVNFEEIKLKKSGNTTTIEIRLATRDFLDENGQASWINGPIQNYFIVDILLLKNKAAYDDFNLKDYEKNKYNSAFKTLSLKNNIAGNLTVDKIQVETIQENLKIIKPTYNIEFNVSDLENEEFIGFVCSARIDENAYLSENFNSSKILNEINFSSTWFDKFILVNNFEIKNTKITNIIEESGQNFLWYSRPNDQTIVKELSFNVKNYKILSSEAEKTGHYFEPINKNLANVKQENYFSDLFFGIDEDLNVKGVFFFDAYKYLTKNSVIYRKLNKNFFKKEQLVNSQNLFSSFDFDREFFLQNKPSNKKKKLSALEEKTEFTVNKNFEFNLDDGIKCINFIDYNVNSDYLDSSYRYKLDFKLLDSIFAITSDVLEEAKKSLNSSKKIRELIFSKLYERKNGTYTNYDFVNNIFTDLFKSQTNTIFANYSISEIINSYIEIDFLLKNKTSRLTVEQIEKFINIDYCSFEDMEMFISSLSLMVNILEEISLSQKNGSFYEISNIFKEKIYLDSTLSAISYVKPDETNERDFTINNILSKTTLPFISPTSILVKDFSGEKTNVRADLIFDDLLKKDVKDILSPDNIDIYDDLMKNIMIKQQTGSTNKITKKTTLLSINKANLSKFKFKIFKKLAKEKYNQNTKKTLNVSRESFSQRISALSASKKKALHSRIFGKKRIVSQNAETDILKVTSALYEENINKINNLKANDKPVETFQSPYTAFLEQIYNGEIVLLQYLEGFEQADGQNILKRPIWSTMTQEILKQKVSANTPSGKESFCRIILVKPEDFLISKDNLDLSLVKLNENFTLKYR